jgi:hypothetical protein
LALILKPFHLFKDSGGLDVARFMYLKKLLPCTELIDEKNRTINSSAKKISSWLLAHDPFNNPDVLRYGPGQIRI